MSKLFVLPPGVVEYEICQFLDAPSLARLSCTNRELHEEISRSQHWATHVSRNFGITVNNISPFSSPSSSAAATALLAGLLQNTNQQSTTKHSATNSSTSSQQATISWRDVFLAAWMDSLALTTAMRDNDILQVYHRHPQVMLSQLEAKIRDEIVLMQGLRRFPSSLSLLSLYAQVIRQELLVVRMVR